MARRHHGILVPYLVTLVQRAPSSREGPRRGGRRVFVVDDNNDARRMLQAALALEGYDVRVAPGGAAALAQMGDRIPDAALIDIGLPDIGGCEVARRLRGAPRGRRIVLIAVTGFGQAEDRQRAFDAGFDAYLTKPVSIERVAEAIAQAGRDSPVVPVDAQR